VEKYFVHVLLLELIDIRVNELKFKIYLTNLFPTGRQLLITSC